MPAPAWSAPRSGLLGDPGAVDASAQINQLLGTHGITAIYQGNAVVSPNGTGAGGSVSNRPLCQYDIDQPFTMSGTAVGRVAVPIIPVGAGADMIVSLCSDNSGSPGAVITQTRIPAAWITQLSYASGVGGVGTPIVFNASGNPLALPQFNAFRMGAQVTSTWPYPSVNSSGGAAAPASCYFGNYLFTVGGVDSNHNVISSVFSSFYDTNGNLSPAVPQASTPTVTDGSGKVIFVADASSGAPILVQVGGGTTYLGAPVATVYTSQLNATTGVLSSWTTQTAFPQIIQNQGMATYSGFVYVIGGASGSAVYNTVYYAQVQNGQIASWKAATPLPQGRQLTYCAASNGFLFVTGGTDQAQTAVFNTTYVAAINADGSLGPWLSGPSLSGATNTTNLDATIYGGPIGLITNVVGQNSTMVAPSGWDGWANEASGGGTFTAYIQTDPITIRVYGANLFGTYTTEAMRLFPNISVPLPATGLTNGATYHVLVQSPSNDLNNYLTWAWDFLNALPGNPAYLFRNRGQTAWASGSTLAMPITVYDGSVTGKLWHLREDGGARISTMAWGGTPNQPLLGLLEATAQPGPVLNQWPTFVQGVGPWHPTGGMFVQSSAQTRGGLPFSGLLTPSGSASQSYAESDLVSVLQGHSYVLTAWYYSPTGYGNVAVSANWFDANKNYISTVSGAATSISSGTWTQFQTTVTNNVTNAAYLDMVCVEGATPPATALLYVSAATVQDTSGSQVSSVVKYNYAAAWPNAGMWPPLGITEVA